MRRIVCKHAAMFCLAWLPFSTASAQQSVPIGQWRTHVSFNSVKAITGSDSRIYAAAGAGLMVLDRQDRELAGHTSLNGLAGQAIHSVNFDRSSGVLFIGYEDGSLDIADNNEITNFNWLPDTPLTGSRAINHITFSGGQAFLSTGYGVVVFDMDRREVRETWRDLGEGGTPLAVNQTTILGNRIFLATPGGVLSGGLDDNLLDFGNWDRHNADELNNVVTAVATFNDKIYAAVEGTGLFHFDNGEWTHDDFLLDNDIQSLNSTAAHLVVCEPGRVWLLAEDGSTEEVTSPFTASFQFAWEDDQGGVWIGDAVHGLLSGEDRFIANGPAFNVPMRLKFLDGKIMAVRGGYDDNFQPLENPGTVSVFADGSWHNETSPLGDITDVAAAGGVVFVSSYGDGVQSGPLAAPETIYNETNSSLINAGPPGDHVRVSGLASDGTRLWVANYGATSPLHSFDAGKWQPYAFAVTAARFPLSLATDYAGGVWAALNPASGGGILVFDSETNNTAYLSDLAGSGGLPSRNVRCLAPDRNGSMWVGTDNGVAYFANPAGIFGTGVNAIRPIFGNRFLLDGEKVTVIAVDGGNRKWIGTAHGVWLFGPNGEEMIRNFTRANSPLPSDDIRSIAIDGQSGEVFFATAAGLVSFQSDATESDGNFSSVRIFPNPVTAEFNGFVGISGLAQDAVVKITDAGGNLVWQTYAAGGTASWNVRHYNGQRAATGVYLVFSASADGSQEYVGKIAVVE